MITRLIVINASVFLAIIIMKVLLVLTGSNSVFITQATEGILKHITMPTNLSEFIYRPYTLLFYMFTHVGFFHILFNMITLYVFGSIFREFYGEKKILPVYLLGGIVGGLLVLLMSNLPFNSDLFKASSLLGASAGVMAIIFAATIIAPNYDLHLFIFGRVPIKYVTIAIVVIDLINIASFQNVGGHIAHFGGAISGFLFAKFVPITGFSGIWSRKNNNDTMTFKKVSMKMSYNKAINDDEYNTVRTSKQQRLDSILDKISEKGYDKLTKEEKEFLSNFKD